MTPPSPSSPDSALRDPGEPVFEDPALARALRVHGVGSQVFGRFRLVRELGAGGMAVVWLASDERLGLKVALKFLPGMVASDPDALHDLRREITRGLRLTHPGIVRVYDLHEDSAEGLAAIGMEYIDGATLTDEKALQPDRCFDVGEPLLTWTRTLCDALSYVHEEARIVHRDLKPRNLMLTADGKLKVTDFGIAASLCDSHSRLTQNHGSSGTPVYMSPQQAAGLKPAATDDIYALGATLYELLTSKPPFFRGSMGIILSQLSTQVPPPMSKRREELEIFRHSAIPDAWEETIAACLAKEPYGRPASAREVASRLGLAPSAAARTAGRSTTESVPFATQSPKAPPSVNSVSEISETGVPDETQPHTTEVTSIAPWVSQATPQSSRNRGIAVVGILVLIGVVGFSVWPRTKKENRIERAASQSAPATPLELAETASIRAVPAPLPTPPPSPAPTPDGHIVTKSATPGRSPGKADEGISSKPFISESRSPASTETWATYPAGNLPVGLMLTAEDLLKPGFELGSSLVYVFGKFTVTASSEARAVLRHAGPSNLKMRVLVEYRRGQAPPSEGSVVDRDKTSGFEVREIRRGSDETTNVFARDTVAP